MTNQEIKAELLELISQITDRVNAISDSSGEVVLPLAAHDADYQNGIYKVGASSVDLAGFIAATGYNAAPPINGGMRLHQPSTNFVYPSDFGTRWVKDNVVLSPVSEGYKLTDNNANGWHQIYVPLSISGVNTSSIAIKAGTCTRGRLWIVDGSPGIYVDFDLTSGTITSSTSGTGATLVRAFIYPEGEYYRVGLTGVATGYFVLCMYDGGLQYTGTGKTLYIKSPQSEAGHVPTEFIATTTSAGSRALDSFSRTVASPSFVCKVVKACTAPAYPEEYAVLYHLDNNLDTNSYNDIEIFMTAAGHLFLRVTWQFTTHYEIDLGLVAPNTQFTLSFCVSSSGIITSLNGGEASTTTVGNMPSDLIKERWGRQLQGIRSWNGKLLREIKYNDLLSSAQLKLASSL